MKRTIAFLLASIFLTAAVFSEKYKISQVNYDIVGMTRQYALERNIEIDKDRIFETFEDFNAYLDNLRQLFKNERNLESSVIYAKYDSELNKEEIINVTLNISTQDSKHFLVVPYPKYNSNDGLVVKLKAKDTNFLGTLETLDLDFNFSYEPQDTDSDSSDYDTIFGINLSYDYPFKLWKLDSKWENSFSLDYTIGKEKPEFSYETGFVFELPLDRLKITLDLTQGIERNFDYTEYGDELFMTESAKLSLPYKIATIDNFDDVTWGPYIAYSWYWDDDGISETNEDLTSPTLKVGHSVSTGRVNWTDNFRDGVDLSMDQYIGYNYQKREYIASVSGTMELYKSFFNRFGIYSRFYGFYNYNQNTSIGSYLRGIRDDQRYQSDAWAEAGLSGEPAKALNTSAAIVMNFDMPFRIITTDWLAFNRFCFGEDSWLTNHLNWMRYFDFELQMSPFVDIAFANNLVTEKTFAIKDGWYAAGLEVLVFPAKWRSLVVRASAGVDIGRKVVKKVISKLIDDDWRKQVSAFELSIGIGLHY